MNGSPSAAFGYRRPGPSPRWAAVVALLVGCASTDGKEGGDPAGTTEPGVDDSGTPDVAETDEDILRAAIAGERDVDEALVLIARQGGLPIQTSASVLFACLCGDGDWSVAGDHDEWAGVAMDRAGALSWAEVDVPAPDGSRYKFTDGTDWMADPLGRRLAYDEFGEISLVDASFAHLERWYAIDGGELQPRDVNVWVPEAGAFTHVVYAHDGQNLFDPGAAWGGWQLSASVPANMLVVGINNTSDRFEEYTHVPDDFGSGTVGGRADDYGVLVSDLRGLMDEHYGPADRYGLLGSSLGGLVSLALAESQTGQWDMAMSMSGTVGWGSIGLHEETIIARLAASAPLEGTAIYADSGGLGTCADSDGDGTDDDGDDFDNYCVNRQLVDVLAASGYAWDENLWHWHEAGATHDEAAWAARVWRPLELFSLQ